MEWLQDTLAVFAALALGPFGIYALLAALLYLLERLTLRMLVRSFGPRAAIYSTGWIGVPVHELSHAVTALAFGHRITSIDLFKPDGEDGTLGRVSHSYNAASKYQRLGNLFIGIAPLVLGAGALVALGYALVPGFGAAVHDVTQVQGDEAFGVAAHFSLVGSAMAETLNVIFAPANLTSWHFWVFLYLSICLSAHLAPSGKDMRHVWPGLIAACVLVLLASAVMSAVAVEPMQVAGGIQPYLAVGAGLLSMAVVLSALNCALAFGVAMLAGPRRV